MKRSKQNFRRFKSQTPLKYYFVSAFEKEDYSKSDEHIDISLCLWDKHGKVSRNNWQHGVYKTKEVINR